MRLFCTVLYCISTLGATAAIPELKFVSLPRSLTAGETYSVGLSCRITGNASSILHLEIKNRSNTVLDSQSQMISETGQYNFEFRASADPTKLRFVAWLGVRWEEATGSLRSQGWIGVYTGDRKAAEEFHRRIGPRDGNRYAVAVLRDRLPGHDLEGIDLLIEKLRSKTYEIHTIDANAFENPFSLSAERFDLLVLPSAGTLPVGGLPTVERFVSEGGDILTLGAPAFSDPLWKSGDLWMTHEAWRQRLAALPVKKMLFDFETDAMDSWARNTNAPESPFKRSFVSSPKGRGLNVHIGNMAGWDGLSHSDLEQPFPEGHTLTTFYAKGSKETRRLMLEWREKDGSRWIATFPVAEEWTRVVLTPDEFTFWESTPGRGGPGDRFRPENAVGLGFGIAWSHTGGRSGEYEFAIDALGTTPNPYGVNPRGVQPTLIVEGLGPSYKYYELNDVGSIAARFAEGTERNTLPLPVAMTMQAHHPRPTGKGYGRGRDGRWIPIDEAWSGTGEWRGAPVSLHVDVDGPARSSVRASMAASEASWYMEEAVQERIQEVVARMAKGIFFQEAGAEFFTYRAGEQPVLGYRVANLSKQDREGLQVRFVLTPRDGSQPVHLHKERFALKAGEVRDKKHSIELPQGQQEFDLTIRLEQNGEWIDEIRHEINLFVPKPESERHFVTTRDGDFYLDGKRWYVHGVNYMPSTGIAIEDWDYFEHWMGSRAYDPEFVQRDLERCREMGLNLVSIFIYHESLGANNLLDILDRCEKLGLKVNLSMRPGTPMAYRAEWWEEIVRANRLWENDTVVAYDIAWEPFFGRPDQRRRYDPDWREWLKKQYGTIEAAERAWSFPAPRFEGRVSTPVVEHLGEDGPHRKMVADYRRFADELIHSKYQSAADRIRAVDLNHLISFRMTVTGDPTFDGSVNMPYDFQSVAESMDIMEPEAYGRVGDWERIKPGRFTVDYARSCAPNKPVIWAEAGVHAWDTQAMRVDPERLTFQSTYFADFYRLVLESHANGVIWWWYPGGYRTNERSDYGILNPDGTDRPCTRTIRRFADAVLEERTIPKADTLLDFDRDSDARGLFGVYERIHDAYWKAIESGQHAGLRLKTHP